MTTAASNRWLLSDADQKALERLTAEFERQWRPGLLEFWTVGLPNYPPTLHQPVLTSWVQIELRHRWQRGDCQPVDAFLIQFPQLGTPATCPIELIAEELFLRRQLGQSEAELLQRFPARLDELRSRIGLLLPSRSLPPLPPPAAPATPLPAPAPTILDGRYQLEQEIGSGGMGKVYRALDLKFQRSVAVKVPTVGGIETELLERFKREAQTLAQLKHPNLCAVYDVGHHNGMPYLVMEYVEGLPLCHWADPQRLLEQGQVAQVLARVASAMQAAHKAGVVHRDLKPSNILLRADGEPIIVDFGLVRLKDSTLTQPGQVLGTPAYMAPEQVQGRGAEVGPTCDIYSLGAVLYELLTGTPAYEGIAVTIIARIINGPPPPPPRELRPDVWPGLEALCLRAMSAHPEERPASMEVLAAELLALLPSDGATLPPGCPPPALPRPVPSTHSATSRPQQRTPASATHQPVTLPTAAAEPSVFAQQTQVPQDRPIDMTAATADFGPRPPGPYNTAPTAGLPPVVGPAVLPVVPPPPAWFDPSEQSILARPVPEPPPRRRSLLVPTLIGLPLLLCAVTVAVIVIIPYLWPEKTTSTERPPPPPTLPGQVHFILDVPPEWRTGLSGTLDDEPLKPDFWVQVKEGTHKLTLRGDGIKDYTETVDLKGPHVYWTDVDKLKAFGRVEIELEGYRSEVGEVRLRVEEKPEVVVTPRVAVELPVGAYTLSASGPFLDRHTPMPFRVERGNTPVRKTFSVKWFGAISRIHVDHLQSNDQFRLGSFDLIPIRDLPGRKFPTQDYSYELQGKWVETKGAPLPVVVVRPGDNELTPEPGKLRFHGELRVLPPAIDEEATVRIDQEEYTIKGKALMVTRQARRYEVSVTSDHVLSTSAPVTVRAGSEPTVHRPEYIYFGTRQLELKPQEMVRRATIKLDGTKVDGTKPLRAVEGRHLLEISGDGLSTQSIPVTFARGRGERLTVQLTAAGGEILALPGGVRLHLVAIEGGTFDHGVPGNELDVRNHDWENVSVLAKNSRVAPFQMSKYEVTQEQFEAVLGKNRNRSRFGGDKLPVEGLTLGDIEEFCKELSKRTGRKVRLPSEKEWEYACRGGLEKPYNLNGGKDSITPADANITSVDTGQKTEPGTVRVDDDRYKPTNKGLHHMHGNVAEVCTVSWKESQERYVLRGGSFRGTANDSHVLKRVPLPRSFLNETRKNDNIGFRIVVE